MRTKRFLSALATLALVAGCSGSEKPSKVDGNNNGAGGSPALGTGGGLAVGASNGLAVGASSGVGAGNGIPDSGVVSPDAACAQSASSASLGSLTMLVMMDDSGSMSDNNKWDQTAAAMKAFFADPAAAGLRVGLRLFPSDLPTQGCTDSVCNQNQDMAVAACSHALVDIAPLTAAAAPTDAQEAKLLAAIPESPQSKARTSGGTPTFAALQGAENIAVEYAAAHPTEKVVVVFVTDGEPHGCDERIDDIAKIAADTLSSHKIATYAIGILGSNQSTMDSIAVAGGTLAGIMIGGASGATTEQDLLKAFGNIQASNVSCDFAVPAPPANLTLSFDNVNVNYTLGNGTAATLTRVEDATKCGKGGWFYDSNSAPAQIHLCANTCTSVQADMGAALQVLYSCVASQGYTPPPK